eukprot:scaffold18210_cov98-Isochrysis_galbana.AAC.3
MHALRWTWGKDNGMLSVTRRKCCWPGCNSRRTLRREQSIGRGSRNNRSEISLRRAPDMLTHGESEGGERNQEEKVQEAHTDMWEYWYMAPIRWGRRRARPRAHPGHCWLSSLARVTATGSAALPAAPAGQTFR